MPSILTITSRPVSPRARWIGVHRGLGAGVREAPVREPPAAAQLLGDDDRALGRRGEVRALVHPRLHGGGDRRGSRGRRTSRRSRCGSRCTRCRRRPRPASPEPRVRYVGHGSFFWNCDGTPPGMTALARAKYSPEPAVRSRRRARSRSISVSERGRGRCARGHAGRAPSGHGRDAYPVQTAPPGTDIPPMRVVIVGAGFGGIAAAIELRQHGFDDVVILDRARRARRHVAPTTTTPARPATCRATCTRSRSRSAATGRGCARRATRSSAYLREVAREHGIDRLVTPEHRGRRAARLRRPLDADQHRRPRRWNADAVIVATGQLHRHALPRLRGDVRGPQLPLRRVGPRLRPARQARRGDRHRARAPCSSSRDRAQEAEQARRLPAHGQLVPAAQATARTRALVKSADRARARRPGLPAPVHLLVRRVR